MSNMKISDIAKEIYNELLTEEERQLNHLNQLPKKLNQLLVQTGDLTVCALGKIETEQGSAHGIYGELVCPEDKPRFWFPQYTNAGREYVRRLFQENRASLIISPVVPDPVYRYTRAVREEVKQRFPQAYVFLLEGPDRYWLFDEDAEYVAEALHLVANFTARGKRNLTYKKPIHGKICKTLLASGISFVIVHPETEEITKAPALAKRVIREGIRFEMTDEDGCTGTYVILDPDENTVLVTIHLADGTSQIIAVPITELEDCVVVSSNSSLASVLMGAGVGEVRSYDGYKYTIISIQD